MTAKNVLDELVKSLSASYEKGEAEKIAEWLIEERLHLTRTDLITGSHEVNPVAANDLAWQLMRLNRGEPVQYVLGKAFFYNLELRVNQSVLIPRPETEELVEWVLDDLSSGKEKQAQVMDAGTGSGCIAIAIKKNHPSALVTATDVSADALKLARLNAVSCGVDIEFIQDDVLHSGLQFSSKQFTQVVSNPPYIPFNEKESLRRNVAAYEPHLALFVPDGDPLIFYKHIAGLSKKILVPGGRLFFEAHPAYADAVRRWLMMNGFSSVELRKDMSGNARMLKAWY